MFTKIFHVIKLTSFEICHVTHVYEIDSFSEIRDEYEADFMKS